MKGNYKFNLYFQPQEKIVFQFILKANEKQLKINVSAITHFKREFNRIDISSTETKSVYTCDEDLMVKIPMIMPKCDSDKKLESYVLIVADTSYGNVDFQIDSLSASKYQQEDGFNDEVKIEPLGTGRIVKKQPINLNVFQQSYNAPPKNEIVEVDKDIVLLSSQNNRCGISIYTEDLYNSLIDLNNKSTDGKKPKIIIDSVEKSLGRKTLKGKVLHIQHEFGILPEPPNIRGNVIITWHTIPSSIVNTVRKFESSLSIAAHIVPCEGALEYFKSSNTHVISLGSKLTDLNITKKDARKLLNIKEDDKIGFVFGFQSPNKNYDELILVAKKTGLHLIISGSPHFAGYKSSILDLGNATFLNRFVSEAEVDLYSIASDILLFDYIPQEHYSSSSALHRTIGSGRPAITSRIKHFSDIVEGYECLKFGSRKELIDSITKLLQDPNEYERLSKASLEFAKRTSWEEVAKKHMEIYRRYI